MQRFVRYGAIMEAMRQSWTDERLDDFRESVDRRFDETNQRMESGFAEVKGELQRVNDRLDGLHHVLIRGMVALVVGLLGVMVALVAVMAQL